MDDAFEPYKSTGQPQLQACARGLHRRQEHTDDTEEPAGNSSTSYGAEDNQTKETSRVATRFTLQKRFDGGCCHGLPVAARQSRDRVRSAAMPGESFKLEARWSLSRKMRLKSSFPREYEYS